MSLYITQLHAGDWYICETTRTPIEDCLFAHRAPVFATKREAEIYLRNRTNPARQALTRAVQKAMAEGAPEFVEVKP